MKKLNQTNSEGLTLAPDWSPEEKIKKLIMNKQNLEEIMDTSIVTEAQRQLIAVNEIWEKDKKTEKNQWTNYPSMGDYVRARLNAGVKKSAMIRSLLEIFNDDENALENGIFKKVVNSLGYRTNAESRYWRQYGLCPNEKEEKMMTERKEKIINCLIEFSLNF